MGGIVDTITRRCLTLACFVTLILDRRGTETIQNIGGLSSEIHLMDIPHGAPRTGCSRLTYKFITFKSTLPPLLARERKRGRGVWGANPQEVSR